MLLRFQEINSTRAGFIYDLTVMPGDRNLNPGLLFQQRTGYDFQPDRMDFVPFFQIIFNP